MAGPLLHIELSSPHAWLTTEGAESVLGGAPKLEPSVLGPVFEAPASEASGLCGSATSSSLETTASPPPPC